LSVPPELEAARFDLSKEGSYEEFADPVVGIGLLGSLVPWGVRLSGHHGLRHARRCAYGSGQPIGIE
jgi:hypothetical protein